MIDQNPQDAGKPNTGRKRRGDSWRGTNPIATRQPLRQSQPTGHTKTSWWMSAPRDGFTREAQVQVQQTTERQAAPSPRTEDTDG